jgi:transposase
MSRKPARKFKDEFRLQMEQLYNSGKPSSEIVKEYDLTTSAFHSWVKKYNKTSSFKAADNLTPEQKELILKYQILWIHITIFKKMMNNSKIGIK